MDMLASSKLSIPHTAHLLQEPMALCGFMSKWESALTSTSTLAELKNEYVRCCSCMAPSEGNSKSVVFGNVPTKLDALLKDKCIPS